MADSPDVKQLLLQVDASVELLRKNLTTGERRVQDFERRVDDSMTRADGHFARLGAGLENVNERIGLVRAAAGALIAAGLTQMLIEGARRGLEFASSLGETAQQLGVNTDELQEYRYAASQAGIEQEAMDKSLAKLTKTIGQALTGGKAQARVFDELGISLRNAQGEVKTAGELIPEIADALAKIPDPARRAAAETALFGKAGQQLDTLLSGGSKAIDELRKAAHDLGIVLSEDAIQNADQTADKLSELQQVLSARISGVVAENATSIYNLANAVATLTANGIKLVNNWPKISGALAGAAIGARVGGVPGAAVGAGVGFLGGLKAAQGQNDGNMDLGFRRGRLDDALRNYNNAKRSAGSPAFYAGAEAELRKQTDLLRKASALAKGGGAAPGAPTDDGAGDVDLDLSGGGGGGGGGGKGSGGPSAAEIEQRYNDMRARFIQQAAGAEESMAQSAEERAKLALTALEAERLRTIDDIESDKNFSADQKKMLLLQADGLAETERRLIEFKRLADTERDAADLAEETFRSQSEALRDLLDLSESTAERRKLAQDIVDLEFRHKQALLDAIINSETASEADKARARIVRDALGTSRDAAKERAARDNETPGEAYLRNLRGEAINLGDAYEDVAVRGMERLNDSLAESAKNALGLHGVLGDIVGDLAEIAIRQSIVGPIANFLFGSGSLFGGFRAGGGPVDAGKAYMVGERGPEMIVPRVSGNVISNSRLGGGGDSVTIPITINAPGATAETVAMMRREIANVAPAIISAATANTSRQMNRRRI